MLVILSEAKDLAYQTCFEVLRFAQNNEPSTAAAATLHP